MDIWEEHRKLMKQLHDIELISTEEINTMIADFQKNKIEGADRG